MRKTMFRTRITLLLAASLFLSACGNDKPAPPPPAIYTLNGTLSGLAGGVLTLANTVNGDTLDIAGNGPFNFGKRVADEAEYNITVSTQPPNQTCTISNGSGEITADNVIDISVRCVTAQYTVGGTVNGLAGTLLLQNNQGNDLTLTGNGAFTFANRLLANSTYSVTVRTQPATQTCTVSNGGGTLSGGNYTGVSVQCVNNTNPFTIGGSVSGLNGTLVIQNNGGNNLTLSANGSFSFSSPLNSGTTYAISVLTQPLGQTCTLHGGSGSGTATANVTGIDIRCVVASYTVGGVINGLASGFALQNNGETLNRTVGGNFVFTTAISHGSPYNVTVAIQPNGQDCSVSNGSGTINGANVANVIVTCSARQHTLGFTVQGLSGTLVVGNGDKTNSVSADGNYTFTDTFAYGSAYNVRIVSEPSLQTCAVSNASGTFTGNVTGVLVTCGFAVSTLVSAPRTLTFNWASRPGATHYRLLKNAGAGYVVLYDNLVATTASEVVSAHLYDWLDTSYMVEACINTNCISSVPVYTTNLMLDSIGYFKASNPGAPDNFGHVVAMSDDGNTMAVSAVGEDSDANGVNGDQENEDAGNAGAVYVFTRSGGNWSQQAYLKASNSDEQDNFGNSLSLSANGNYLAVAAPFEGSNSSGNQADNSLSRAGAVYVFARSGGSWSQQAYIKASDAGAADYFGSVNAGIGVGAGVALSADGATLAVGAPGHATETISTEDTDPVNRGAVYIFRRTGTSWSEQARLEAFNADDNDYFGYAVALSDDGNVLAAGAPFEGSIATGVDGDPYNNLEPFAGAVYLFRRSGTVWTHEAYVKATNSEALDRFGNAVALSGDGNTLAIAATREDSASTAPPSDNSAVDSGAVFVVARNGGVWAHEAMLKSTDGRTGNGLGNSLAISGDGNVIAAGMPTEDGNTTGMNGDATSTAAGDAGAVVVFRRNAGSWQQHSYVKASNTSGGANFGNSVAVNADGSMLAVGAPWEFSSASGIGGSQTDRSMPGAGAVYLY